MKEFIKLFLKKYWIKIYKIIKKQTKNKEDERITEIMTNFLGCGDVAKRTAGALYICGIKNRLVSVKTKDVYDNKHDGHTLIEIMTVNGWILYDSFLGFIFSKDKSKPLNVVDACSSVNSNSYYVDYIGSDKIPNKIFDMELDKWMKRVYQVPLIYDDDKFYTYDLETVERNKINQYFYLPYEEFMDKFYRKY